MHHMEEILIPLSVACSQCEGLDSVALRKSFGGSRVHDILLEARRSWDSMARFRKDRERNKRYTYGRQWDDLIHVDGKTVREEDYIASQGNVALKNNIIRKIVRTLLGVYRQQSKEPTCTARDRDEQKISETMSTILQCNMQLNRRKDLDARSFEEYVISGLVVHKKWYGWRNGKLDCWTDYVNPNNFFIDSTMRDFRGWDVSLLGEIHDITFDELCNKFANTPDDVRKLREIYASASNPMQIREGLQDFGFSDLSDYDFMLVKDPSLCRVIEVWRKESKPRYRCYDYNNGTVFKVDVEDYDILVGSVNARRLELGMSKGMKPEDIPIIKAEWFIDSYWYYYYLTPFGHILQEGETPYDHNSHPYVFKAYPFIDGEIHSFVSDFIDQQRYINRLITMYDWLMRSSAKGLLLFPEDCLPKGMTIEDVADEWARFNGMIVIKKGSTMLPQQISNNATNIGVGELLNLQLKLIEDISGVSGSLQGKQGFSGMSASLYAQQTMNSTASLLDILETFSTFIIDAAYKDVKNMQQFYDSKRVFNISGKSSQVVEYDPARIGDVEFDISIVESTSTPAYRQIANDFLMQIWQTGQISLEQLLEFGDFPFSDDLLASVKSMKEQAMQGQQPSIPQELRQQVASQSNPQAEAALQNALQG